MVLPEYTLSLALWIVPSAVLTAFILRKRLLSREKRLALLTTIGAIAVVSFALDILYARNFFLFPNEHAILNIRLLRVPIEEFVFWVSGNWFILSLYVFCDEWYLRKYNPPDERYVRYRKKLKRLLFAHPPSIIAGALLLAAGCIVKRLINPQGALVPGYFCFLVLFAYVPAALFYRVTRLFVNWRAFVFCVIVTVLVCLIWEVTLALPRGYWNYQHGAMLGVYLRAWNGLPLEESTVWVVCSMEILVYEFIKICFFTRAPARRRR